ncbi:hypothetical protein DRZ02_10540 [Salmonella enterica subsp. enterica serovar Llandoff]|nr:hypothetical protein [Salmonella enterica subsp. enterica serovar Llandoff]EDS3305912.1 hypothetical protein [Salmonella enterica subsp. enterica serovar Umbadah]EBR0148100.1 hypothetical protein [Salmonella enterica subsp. enterica serovar Llandoff]EBX4586413.1 hypothetical protein [Salmonella enterica subsp. enterica serovar Llandoff]EDY6795885.1 hypothetical protein [Salmonella enterica subsp. enterica serovar Umbadah]
MNNSIRKGRHLCSGLWLKLTQKRFTKGGYRQPDRAAEEVLYASPDNVISGCAFAWHNGNGSHRVK